MSWLNVFALALFLLLQLLVRSVCRQPDVMRRRTVRTVCMLLLGGNLVRYLAVYPLVYHVIRIPAEFSTVAYFAVPIILLAGWRRLNCWAAYSGLLAGACYYAAMIAAGASIYGADAPLNTCISLLCHGSLYFCGAVTITETPYPQRQTGLLLFGTGYIALRAAVLRPLVLGRDRMLIYILMDALPMRIILPETQWPEAMPVYYLLLGLVLLLSVQIFYAYSDRQFRHFSALRSLQPYFYG